MHQSVLGVYATPPLALYRDLGDGVLSLEALRVAGAKAERKTRLGWALIMLMIGEGKAGKAVIKHFHEKGYKSNEILALLKVIVPDHLCKPCNGTGSSYSKTGKRFIDCKSCGGSGRAKIRLERICHETGATKDTLEEMITHCLKERSDAEQAITKFLRREAAELN